MDDLVLLKLGGSLITDKTRAYIPRHDQIERVAAEICRALAERPGRGLILGHGSGSFGHAEAARHGTRQGVRTAEQWRGLSAVSAAAARLNRIVVDTFLEAGIPAISFQPSSSARCRDGRLVHWDVTPLRCALESGLVPLVYGDVAMDEVRGGTIVSTEALFVCLMETFAPKQILLVGEPPGVVDERGQVISRITPQSLPAIQHLLSGSHGVDVTGGMADKVSSMIALVERYPAVQVRILSGVEPDHVYRALTDLDASDGTCIAMD